MSDGNDIPETSPLTGETLHAALMAAHEAQDLARLVVLYALAGAQSNDPVARGFFLTHAYVFALERGDPAADVLRLELVAMGRETA